MKINSHRGLGKFYSTVDNILTITKLIDIELTEGEGKALLSQFSNVDLTQLTKTPSFLQVKQSRNFEQNYKYNKIYIQKHFQTNSVKKEFQRVLKLKQVQREVQVLGNFHYLITTAKIIQTEVSVLQESELMLNLQMQVILY